MVLNFWAIWCGSCVLELKGLEEFQGKQGCICGSVVVVWVWSGGAGAVVIITNLATAVLIAIATGAKAYTAKRDFGKTVMGDVGVGD